MSDVAVSCLSLSVLTVFDLFVDFMDLIVFHNCLGFVFELKEVQWFCQVADCACLSVFCAIARSLLYSIMSWGFLVLRALLRALFLFWMAVVHSGFHQVLHLLLVLVLSGMLCFAACIMRVSMVWYAWST